MRPRNLLLATLAFGYLMNARGQAQPNPVFEVASVRPWVTTPPGANVFFGPPRGGPGTSDPEKVTWTAASLLSILMAAYDVQAFQINAPDWAPNTRYNIAAKVPAGTTKAQLPAMWQSLLKERLALAVHHESMEFRVYELTVAKGGPKLKETDLPSTAEPFDFGAAPMPKPGPNGALDINGTGSVLTVMQGANGAMTARLAAKGFTMADLAQRLGGWTALPVVDKTGLTARFDFELEFTADGLHPPNTPTEASEPGSNAAAVERQLGLKLTEAKAMLDVIVVDHAEKVPTEN